MTTNIPVRELSPECRERQLCAESRRSMAAINEQLLAENRRKRRRDWQLMLLGAMWAAIVLSLGMCAAFYFSK